MTRVIINNDIPQAELLLAYIRTLPFVEIEDDYQRQTWAEAESEGISTEQFVGNVKAVIRKRMQNA